MCAEQVTLKNRSNTIEKERNETEMNGKKITVKNVFNSIHNGFILHTDAMKICLCIASKHRNEVRCCWLVSSFAC